MGVRYVWVGYTVTHTATTVYHSVHSYTHGVSMFYAESTAGGCGHLEGFSTGGGKHKA